jgi:predicted transcriptional regulator
MDTPTERIDWRTVLREQGRSIAWLADQTEKSRRTVYAYSRGDLVPTPEWLAEASRVLGQEVAA